MATDDYHEAILQRLYELQEEITGLTHREAMSFAYLMSQEIPEEAARMLVAEMLIAHWERSRSRASAQP